MEGRERKREREEEGERRCWTEERMEMEAALKGENIYLCGAVMFLHD